jgi:hypothetical protein
MDCLPRLRIIARTGIGGDRIDLVVNDLPYGSSATLVNPLA